MAHDLLLKNANVINEDGRPLKRNGMVEAVSETVNKLSAVSKRILNRGKGVTNLNF